MGSSVRKVRIQGREGDEDRRLSLASQPFSEAVTQVSDGFPFDRRLIEVSSSPGLWPDRLERFLQFEAVAFYECKSNRLGSQPSHLTGSVRTIFVQDVISSLQTSAQRNSMLLPSPISVVHKNAQRPRLLPEPSRQSGAGHGKSLAIQERYGKVLRSAWARQLGGRIVLSIGQL